MPYSERVSVENVKEGFKPCYKWNTFNTKIASSYEELGACFKPCYKWNTFNTEEVERLDSLEFEVLNLVINGIPSILVQS